MRKIVLLVLFIFVLTACEKETPVEQSIRLLVKSMQGEGDFGKVEKWMVSDREIRPDWKVMDNRKWVSWDWLHEHVRERMGEHPKLARMEVHEMTIGGAEKPISTHKANVLLFFEGAPDTLWVHCGLNTGYILNFGYWENGRLVTDAAD